MIKKTLTITVLLMVVLCFSAVERRYECHITETERIIQERVSSVEDQCYAFLVSTGKSENSFQYLDTPLLGVVGFREASMSVGGKSILCMLSDTSSIFGGAYGYCLTRKEIVDLDSVFDDSAVVYNGRCINLYRVYVGWD